MMIPDPSCRHTPEYQKKLERRADRHFFGSDYPDVEWVDQLIVRLKEIPSGLDYTERDYADIEKARHILYRIAVRKGYNPNEPRVPSGNPDGGQWTDAGGGSARTGALSSIRDNPLFTPTAYKPSATAKPRGYIPNNKNPDKPVYSTGKSPVTDDDWNIFNSHLLNTSGLDPVEKNAYLQTFGAEGGMTEAGNGAVAGITKTTLADAKADPDLADTLKDVRLPSNLKPEDIPSVYKYYFDARLKLVGGSAALTKVGDPYAAAALADTVFEHGGEGGAHILLDTVNNVYVAQGWKDKVIGVALKKGESLAVGTKFFGAYSELAKNPATLGKLLDALGDRRTKAIPKEQPRFDYFKFKKERSLRRGT